jgi:hypothetical protein
MLGDGVIVPTGIAKQLPALHAVSQVFGIAVQGFRHARHRCALVSPSCWHCHFRTLSPLVSESAPAFAHFATAATCILPHWQHCPICTATGANPDFCVTLELGARGGKN